MKIRVRQISQGVEDLSWRNITATAHERDGEEDSEATPPVAGAEDNDLMTSPVTKAEDPINGEITTGLDYGSLKQ